MLVEEAVRGFTLLFVRVAVAALSVAFEVLSTLFNESAVFTSVTERFWYAEAESSQPKIASAQASANVTVLPCMLVRFASVSIDASIVASFKFARSVATRPALPIPSNVLIAE